MAEQTNGSYPMISEKNWWMLRDKFKAALLATATPNYIKTLLTLSSDGSANSNVIAPMKRLGLLDDDNKPTDLANDWRLDNKYKDSCAVMIKQVYPTELLDLFPDENVEKASARNWFMGKGVGQGAADKMVALFVLLKSSEIREKKTTTTKKVTPTKATGKQTDTTPKADDAVEQLAHNTGKTVGSATRPNLHIDLQIHISPDSAPDQIDAIFASMAKHLYGANC